MRRIWVLSSVLLVIVLSGCGGNMTDDGGCKEGYYLVEDECKKQPNDVMQEIGEYSVVDMMEYNDLTSSDLTIYESVIDSGVDYVNMEEFYNALSGVLVELAFDYDETLTVSHTFTIEDDSHTMSMIWDDVANTIYYSDFNFNTILNLGMDTDYVFEFDVLGYNYNNPNTELTIDLDQYTFDIIEEDGAYYIPLYLANLFLTGDQLSVFVDDDKMYVIDDFATATDLFGGNALLPTVDETKLIDDTVYYTALFFDYFYGLKAHEGIESTYDLLLSYDIDEIETIVELDQIIQEMIYDLDDIHTQILDYGFDAKDVELIYPRASSKLYRFYMNLTTRQCVDQTSEVYFREMNGYNYLQVNSFSLETKDLLEFYLHNFDNENPIYIDVSCNTGGHLVAVFDLLSYMTNEPFSFHYTNPATGEEFAEIYQSQQQHALENEFFVYTSPTTFSAANLFVSLVMEEELGFVFGSKTSGGAAAVSYHVLPNNLVLSYSTNFLMTDGDYHDIEDGITPLFTVPTNYTFNEAYSEVSTLFSNNATFQVDLNDSLSSEIDLDFHVTNVSSSIDIVKYTVETRHAQSGLLISSTDYYVDQFTYTSSQTFQDLIDVVIVVEYQYKGYTIVSEIYRATLDELAETVNPDTASIQIGDTMTTTIHDQQDVDIVKVVITEMGGYRILIDGETDRMSHTVYNEQGDAVAIGNDFVLDPGTYYIKLDTSRVDSLEYNLKLQELYDDNYYGTGVTLVEGDNQVTLTYDYYKDKEWIEFTVTEESLININMGNTYISSDFYIADANGERYNHASDYLFFLHEHEYVFPPGTYQIRFHRDMAAQVLTINLHQTTLTNDISGDQSLTSNNYGTFVEGDNLFHVNGQWDVDIFTYHVTEQSQIQVQSEQGTSCALYDGNGDGVLSDGQMYDLPPATYYIACTSFEDDVPYDATITLIVHNDVSTEDNPLPITIGEPFTVTIEWDNDQDYYTFTLTERTTLTLQITDGHPSSHYIYDADGNEVVRGSYGSDNFELPAGDYTLVIGEHISNSSDIYVWDVMLSVLDTADTDPGMMGLDASEYTTISLPTDALTQFNGKLDYEGDVDVYLIQIETSGSYKLGYYADYASFYIVDGDTWTKWRSNYNVDLEAGTYYLVIYHSSNTSTDEYTMVFFDSN